MLNVIMLAIFTERLLEDKRLSSHVFGRWSDLPFGVRSVGNMHCKNSEKELHLLSHARKLSPYSNYMHFLQMPSELKIFYMQLLVQVLFQSFPTESNVL